MADADPSHSKPTTSPGGDKKENSSSPDGTALNSVSDAVTSPPRATKRAAKSVSFFYVPLHFTRIMLTV